MGKSDDILEAWAILYKLWKIFFIVLIFLIIVTVGFPYSAHWGINGNNNPNYTQTIFLHSSHNNLLWM